METNAANLVIFGLVHLVLPASLLVRAYRFPSPRELAAWAGAYRLDLTDGNQAIVAARLRRSRRFRALGGAVGWVISGLPLIVGQPLPSGLDGWTLALGGYFGGAALAELTLAHGAPKPAARRAALATREVEDYLAAWVRRLSWAAMALAVALLPVYGSLSGEGVEGWPSVAELLPGVLTAVVVVVAAELAQRRIVDRAQPLAAPDLVAADDALRAASVATAAAAGMIVALSAFAGVIGAIARLMQTDWLRWPLHLVALGAVLLAFSGFFSAFRPEPWWFGRRHAERVAA